MEDKTTKILSKDLFCNMCSLRFYTKPVFDFHMFQIHGHRIETQQEVLILKNEAENLKSEENKKDKIRKMEPKLKKVHECKQSARKGNKAFKCDL